MDILPVANFDPNLVKCSAPVSTNQLAELQTVVAKYARVFPGPKDPIGCTSLTEHVIEIELNARAIHLAPYPVSAAENEIIDAEISKLLKANIIEPSYSAWASLLLLIKDKTGKK